MVLDVRGRLGELVLSRVAGPDAHTTRSAFIARWVSAGSPTTVRSAGYTPIPRCSWAACGRAYAASDPHLLRWVHVAEVDSFLRTYQTYGRAPLTPAEQDQYLADTGRVAQAFGVPDPPLTVAELRDQLHAYRPELRGTPEARAAARFILIRPPLPLAARPAYALLAAAAVASLPLWARLPLRLPYLPLAEATVVRAAGNGIVHTIRRATAPPARQSAERGVKPG